MSRPIRSTENIILANGLATELLFFAETAD